MKAPNTKLQTPSSKHQRNPKFQAPIRRWKAKRAKNSRKHASLLRFLGYLLFKVQSSWPASVTHANAVKERSAPYGVGVVVCRRARFTGDICGQRREGW